MEVPAPKSEVIMRIIHFIDYFQPKLGYQETFLAREHARMGHDVYVVTSDRYSPAIDTEKTAGGRLTGVGFAVEEGIRVWRLKTRLELQTKVWLQGLETKIQELAPDVVIVHGIASLSAIRIARLKSKAAGFKLVLDDHMTPELSRSRLKAFYPLFKLAFSRSMGNAADALVAVGEPSKIFMHKVYGFPLQSIKVIPMGADSELFHFDIETRSKVRSRLGINKDDVVVIYTGKIIPYKRVDLLIEAAKSIPPRSRSFRVLILGSGESAYITILKQQIAAAGLQEVFIWHEPVPNTELPDFYSAADVAVWPAGASISMLEAMACRLPIIVSDSTNINELTFVQDHLTYADYSYVDLARQIEKLLDPNLRNELGRRNRQLIEDRLNWREIARQFIDMIKE